MELYEWTSVFIDSLDMFRKEITSKERHGDLIKCSYKSKGEVIYVTAENLQENIMQKIETGQVVLVCLNRKENLSFVVKNWEKLIKNKKLKIVFANPDANAQWSVLPFVHDMISDPKNLKAGLQSIMESVPLA